mmetsp:Transcript_3262/g.13686  ORF Transcript_3262/g.13686 Transcript_3262/m.13686 type:complete len:216 (+) Transcript_3262:1165-1812(+)
MKTLPARNNPSSLGAERAVAGVAQARHDVPLVVELLVDHGGVQSETRVFVRQNRQRGRARHDAHDADVAHVGAARDALVDGLHHRAAGGEHGVGDEDALALREPLGELVQVHLRLQRLFVTHEPEVVRVRRGEHRLRLLQEHQAGAEHGHHRDGLRRVHHLHVRVAQGSLHLGLERGEPVARALVDEQASELGERAAEDGRRGLHVARDRQPVVD